MKFKKIVYDLEVYDWVHHSVGISMHAHILYVANLLVPTLVA